MGTTISAESCVFCRILAGEASASLVLHGHLVVAFLDIRPANPGHTLVAPRRHVQSLTDLSTAELSEMASAGQRIASALKRESVPCDGITWSLADGASAGQDVFHIHLHVIPRFPGDGLGWRAPGRLTERAALDAVADRLRTALANER